MLYVNGLEGNVLDLDKSMDAEYTLNVVSTNKNGKDIPFTVEIVSSECITSNILSGNNLKLTFDLINIKKEESITLVNSIDERYVIKILPNIYLSEEKEYKFKVTKRQVDDNTIKIKILSTENERELGFQCTYDGRPCKYEITPSVSSGSTYVTIKSLTTVSGSFNTLIRFEQDFSNKSIEIIINNIIDDKIDIVSIKTK